jgi:hypothetical protein
MKQILFNGASYVSMGGGIILSDNTIPGTGIWQVGVRCASGHNCMDILFEDANNLPGTYNAEGYTAYARNAAYCHSYISGAYGPESAIDGISLGRTQDTSWCTIVFDFTTNRASTYRNGTLIGKDCDISYLNGKDIRCIMQNFYSDPHGQAWFQDGSPSNPITYPVPGVFTLSNHLNILYYDAMKDKNEFAYGYK